MSTIVLLFVHLSRDNALMLLLVRSAHRQRWVDWPPTEAVVAGSRRRRDDRADWGLDDNSRYVRRRTVTACCPWTALQRTSYQVHVCVAHQIWLVVIEQNVSVAAL